MSLTNQLTSDSHQVMLPDSMPDGLAGIEELRASRIFVAGHRGMVGSAMIRLLTGLGCEHLITAPSSTLDLRQQQSVDDFYRQARPEVVIFTAARVGGILANHTYPAQFIYDNVAMAVHSIEAAYRHQVRRFLYLGSTCIYPRDAQQPLSEDSLLTGPLESTNEAYAIAKITGLKLCQFYRRQYGVMFHSAMPTNLYGPCDNYHPHDSHVLPALIGRFHAAKEQGLPSISIWGSGTPRREFLHVDDLAEALLYLLVHPEPPDWVNVGTGTDITILELARMIAEIVGYRGEIQHDLTKPDGTPVKRTDTTRMNEMGWRPRIGLREGIERTYADYLERHANETVREPRSGDRPIASRAT